MDTPIYSNLNRIYDGYADSYGYDIGSTMTNRLKHDLLVKYIEPHSEVLDVGCANGIHIQAIARRCASVTGVDINETMLTAARRKLQDQRIRNATLVRQSGSDLAFGDESFDVAYSFSTLLLIPDTERTIEQIARVVKKGGIAILDITGRYNLSQLFWSRFYRAHGHFGVCSFSYKRIRAFLSRLDLRIIEKHALGFTDQWKYLPILSRMSLLNRLFHSGDETDFDYLVSNSRIVFPLANRWYLVCRKGRALQPG